MGSGGLSMGRSSVHRWGRGRGRIVMGDRKEYESRRLSDLGDKKNAKS